MHGLAGLTDAQRREVLQKFGDWPTFARQSQRLANLAGDVVRFSPNKAQLRQWAARKKAYSRDNGRGFQRVVYLKARRVGGSMGTAAMDWHETAFFPGRRALLAASKQRNTDIIFKYTHVFHKEYVPFGPPGAQIALPRLTSPKGEPTNNELEYENGAKVACITGGSPDSFRGDGVHHLLLDEFAHMENQAKILSAALKLVPKLPHTSVTVCSTANGMGNEFYELCQRGLAGNQGWDFLFFGWWEEPTYKWPLSVEPAKFQESMKPEEWELMRKYSLSLEQINWRRFTINTECGGDPDDFKQEYPATPEEAFLHSGRPRFQIAVLDRQPTVEETLDGELVEVPVGLRREIQFRPNPGGVLHIVRGPQRGRRYAIGADPSKGIDISKKEGGKSDPDYSAATVIDMDTGMQVAQLTLRQTPATFAAYVCGLGKYYNYAFLCPERNELGFIEAILREDYPIQLLYMKERDPGAFHKPNPHEIGYLTMEASRKMLLDDLEVALEDGSISCTVKSTLRQLRTMVIKPNGRAEAGPKSHDDEVFSLALAWQAYRLAPRDLKHSRIEGWEHDGKTRQPHKAPTPISGF